MPRRYERVMIALTRRLTALLWLAVILIAWPNFASGLSPTIEVALPASVQVSLQFHALAGQRCFSKADYADAIRQRCGEADNKAAEYKTCTEVRDAAQTDATLCRGNLQAREVDFANLTLKNDELKLREARRWSPLAWYLIGVGSTAAAVIAAAFVFR